MTVVQVLEHLLIAVQRTITISELFPFSFLCLSQIIELPSSLLIFQGLSKLMAFNSSLRSLA